MSPEQISQTIVDAFRLARLGDYAGAIDLYRAIIGEHPDNGTAHYYMGQLLLAQGRYDPGWAECEWRPVTEMPPSIVRWTGDPIPGGTLFIAGEQGYGDNIQFVRYASLVAERAGCPVVVGTRTGLGVLTATVPGLSHVVEEGGALPKLTHYVPLLSLPHIFQTRAETIPASIPYMAVNPAKVAEWKERLEWIDGPKIGLVWAGNAGFSGDYYRSPGFDPFRILFQVPGVTFFSLQKGDGAQALSQNALPANLFDLSVDIETFEDTAAAIMAMDLVISSCTSPVHLAGALGKPVWVVLSSFPDWRWQLERDDSPWYPSARLFRQERDEPWSGVLTRVAQALLAALQP